MHSWLFHFSLFCVAFFLPHPFVVRYLGHISFRLWSPAFGSPWFIRGGCWLVIISSHVHKPLAPTARSLLRVLRHATLKFAVVVAHLFTVSCDCPKVFHLSKQRHKMFLVASDVEKNDFPFISSGSTSLSGLCIFHIHPPEP